MKGIWLNMRRIHGIKSCRPETSSYILSQEELDHALEKAWYEGFNTAGLFFDKQKAQKKRKRKGADHARS